MRHALPIATVHSTTARTRRSIEAQRFGLTRKVRMKSLAKFILSVALIAPFGAPTQTHHRRHPRQANRNLLSTARTSTKTEYGFTRPRIPRTVNSPRVRLPSVVTGATASADITEVRVRTMLTIEENSLTSVEKNFCRVFLTRSFPVRLLARSAACRMHRQSLSRSRSSGYRPERAPCKDRPG